STHRREHRFAAMRRRQFSASILASSVFKRMYAQEQPQVRSAAIVTPIQTVSKQAHLYHGWPTVARRSSGELVLVWSGGREAHVCPFGRVECMISRDEGKSWSWPRVLMDSDLDDRDAGVVETSQGTLLVTTFTSLAYEAVLARARRKPSDDWPAARLARWEAVQKRLSPEDRKALLGCWMLRSTDGGVSWSTPYRVPINSPHGPIAVSDRRVLYAAKDLYGPDGAIGVCESSDDGLTWRWLAKIPARPGDQVRDYHELHMVETSPGRLLSHIRNHNTENRNETLQSESGDGGKTWSVPRAIGVWGLPSHLLRLRDGRLLMTYGYRRAPFGNQARVSDDDGKTWSEPVALSADGASGDLGYPSTVELADASLLTVWYERLREAPEAVLRQVHWRLESI
ncbi:MAG: sialidase family protein, partial [Bryobacteraceae bacterium]